MHALYVAKKNKTKQNKTKQQQQHNKNLVNPVFGTHQPMMNIFIAAVTVQVELQYQMLVVLYHIRVPSGTKNK